MKLFKIYSSNTGKLIYTVKAPSKFEAHKLAIKHKMISDKEAVVIYRRSN